MIDLDPDDPRGVREDAVGEDVGDQDEHARHLPIVMIAISPIVSRRTRMLRSSTLPGSTTMMVTRSTSSNRHLTHPRRPS
jgi:hypothetical protein